MRVRVPKWSELEWEMDTRQQGKSRRLVGHDTWWIVPIDLIVPVEPTARLTDPITSVLAARAQTPNKVRTEHRLVLELLQFEPLSDFDLASRATQALHRPVKQTSIGVRRNYRFLRRAGLSAGIVRSLLLDAYATGSSAGFHYDTPKPAIVDRVDAARSAGQL